MTQIGNLSKPFIVAQVELVAKKLLVVLALNVLRCTLASAVPKQGAIALEKIPCSL
ncbi:MULTISPECIES: hypothetical protein [unclassified Leptolyngbya]|uniref:hypothetical protein n=1 Tax=unclassified Leptolyngbya TaxID=2650499 RepID=UPI001687595B|nr:MULTISPECIES: hypothetical protein [unclassified Leptolyngbya]